MHEVEPLVLHPGEQRAALGSSDGVPAHVGQHGGGEPVDDAGPLAAALGAHAALVAGLEQHLHPDADAEHRAAAGEPASDDLPAADRPQAGHARGEGSDAGHHETVGLLRLARIGADHGVGAGRRERALGRAKVARAVIEYDDAWRGHWVRLRERKSSFPLAPGRQSE